MLKTSILMLIRIYQLTRSLRSSCCRFYPSCSDYCIEAIEMHGVTLGLLLFLKRLLKCHPWHDGGVDFVGALGANKAGIHEF